MNIFRGLKSALNYANYDFYKLKKEVVNLVRIGRMQGLDNPDYCKITIKNVASGWDFPVKLDLYYKVDGNQVMYLPQDLLIGSFSSMPSLIKSALISEGQVEIKINNLAELYISAEEEVEKPINFNSIVNFGFSQQMITSRKVTIKDEIFTYRVIYDYEANVTAKKTKVITYADIVGMPDDVIQKMKSDGNCKIKID